MIRLRLDDTWNSRDLPVLVDISARADKRETVQLREVAADTGLDEEDVLAAIEALEVGGYLREDTRKKMLNGAGDIYVTMPGWLTPTSAARREVGLWPTEESVLDRIVAQLEASAAHAPDEHVRNRAQRVLDGLLEGGKELGIAVAAAVLTGQAAG